MSDFNGLMQQANLIGGEWCNADSGRTFPVTNPATGAVIGHVPDSGADETNRAIAAAKTAFQSWSRSDLSFRVGLLHKLHDALMDNQESLAQLLTAEQGKPLAEARGEIAIGAAYIRWFAEEIRRAKGEIVPVPTANRRLLVTRHPVGVVGAITPWNFPSWMLARKLGPALAAGCTVVVKPAAATPYSGLVWGKLAQDVGFPDGVVNILTGSARAIGGTIMASLDVRKVTFTGSTAVGKTLIRQSADTVKKVSMELGGNAPFIVFDDADLDAANATEFGLAAYAYTRDLGRAFRLNEELEYGLIGINSGLITTVEISLGVLKESGMGKEGGSQGLDDYLSTKYTCVAGLTA